jgi:LEA14-like dessication related protein
VRSVARRAWGTLGFTPLLVVAACHLAYTTPTLTVGDVRLTSLGLAGGSLLVSLEIENPNRYALESRDFRYTLAFAGGSLTAPVWDTLVEGHLDQVVRVPAESVTPVEVTVPFDVASASAALGRLLRQGELEYRFSGELLAGTPLGAKRVPFDRRGLFRP